MSWVANVQSMAFKDPALREHARHPQAQSSLSLLPLNRDIHDIPLAVHEQEGEVGGFEGIGEALQDRKTVYMLSV